MNTVSSRELVLRDYGNFPKSLYSFFYFAVIMSEERLTQIRDQLFSLERRIRPLEWDASRSQINEFKRAELQRLKQEQSTLLQELQALEMQ